MEIDAVPDADSTTSGAVAPKRMRFNDPGSTYITSGASGGAPGYVEYENWKVPDAETKSFHQAFYIEILNANFLQGAVNRGTSAAPALFNYHVPPYYIWPWQQLCWYIDYAQYNWLKKYTNHAKIKKVTWQAMLVGQRLPFSTNASTTSIANSQVDQTLDYFEAVEKREAFDTYFIPDGATNLEQAGVRRIANAHDMRGVAHHLWGDPRDSALAPDISAHQGNRKWHLRPTFVTRRYVDAGTVSRESEYKTWQPWAREKKMTIDTKTAVKPSVICTVEYTPKNGILNHGRPMGVTTGDPIKQLEYGMHNRRVDYAIQTEAAGGNSEMDTSAYDIHKIDPVSGGKVTLDNTTFRAYWSKEDHQWAHLDVECFPNINTRQDHHIPSYRSLFFGIRPQMNGDQIQQGILQLEIRTQIEFEYQIYMPLPATIYWQYADNWDGAVSEAAPFPGNAFLTNDEDILLRKRYEIGWTRMPGNKLIAIPLT